MSLLLFWSHGVILSLSTNWLWYIPITYTVCWHKTSYEVSPVVWVSLTVRLVHAIGETSYKVLYQHTLYVILFIMLSTETGPPREIMQGGTRLLWDPGDSLRLLSKLRIWASIKPLVNFHKCFISCAAECPDNIYFIQSSDKHNQLMQQGVTC